MLPRFQLPLTEGGAALVSLGLDFWADALGLRGYRRSEAEAASHLRVGYGARMLPAGRAPDLPGTPVPGTRGKRVCALQIGGQEGRVEIALHRPTATGALVPALRPLFLHILATSMAIL